MAALEDAALANTRRLPARSAKFQIGLLNEGPKGSTKTALREITPHCAINRYFLPINFALPLKENRKFPEYLSLAQHAKHSWLAIRALLLCNKNFQRDSAIRYSRFDRCCVQ